MQPPVHDSAAMAVLADALLAQGDARGEVIALQLAQEERPADRHVARLVERALATHAKALLGRLSTRQTLLTLTWTRGYVTHAKVSGSSSPQRLERTVRELLGLESARPLEALTVVFPRTPESFAVARGLARWLSARPAPRSMVTLAPPPDPYDGWCDCPACRAERLPVTVEEGALVALSSTCAVHPLLDAS